jgi:hypothetical protein
MSDTLSLTVTTWGKSTPVLKLLRDTLEDLEDLNEFIALESEEMIRLWILDAAEDRHDTAQNLGAEPTGYLSKAAEQTTSQSTPNGATVTVRVQIFNRGRGPVEVLPRRAKLLTVPMAAESYGKRARDFKDLRIAKSKKGTLFLVRDKGTGKNKTSEKLFKLIPKATLPQDAGLLPGPKRRAETAEKAARDYLAVRIQKGGFKR